MRSRDLDDTALPYRWFFLRGNFARNVMETLKVCIIQIKLILIVCPAPATKLFFSSYEQLCPFLSLSPNNPIEGLNLWDEFDRARVLDFLRQLYSQNRLLQQVSHLSLVAANMCKILKFDSIYLLKCIPQGLSGSNTGLGHALVPLAREDEKLDTGNFRF